MLLINHELSFDPFNKFELQQNLLIIEIFIKEKIYKTFTKTITFNKKMQKRILQR